MSTWTDIGVAVGSAVTGGGFIKILEMWLNKRKQLFDENKTFRDEYRGDIKDLREQITQLRIEISSEKKSRELAEREANYWQNYSQALVANFRLFQLDMKEVLKLNGISIPEEKFTVIEFPIDYNQ